MKNKKLIVWVFVLAFFIPFLANSQTVSAQTDTSLSDVIAAGEIHIGIEAAYPPFEQLNVTTDEVEGFDPSIMEYIADDMGIDIVWHDVAWSTIFTSLASGAYDSVMSAVTITTDRMATMDFTRWYFFSTQAVMVTTTNPKSIADVTDVDDATVKVGIQGETTSQWYLEDEEYAAEMVSFATITLAIQALDSGTVDVVLGDLATLVAAGEAVDPVGFEIVDHFSPEAFGIACQDGASALVNRMNKALDDLLGGNPYNPEFSTYYNETYETWMGSPPVVDLAQVKIALDDLIPAGTDTSLSDVFDAGEIHIGIEAAYPPFEQLNVTTDEVEGFDPSIMEYIAADMGIEIVWHDVAWSTIFTSLTTGSYDCVMSAVTITTDRMATMDFTRWYFFSTQAVMVTTANPKSIADVTDVDDATVKVGIQGETTSQWYLEDEEYAAEMVSFATITLAIQALDAGTVDVVLGDLATLVAAGEAIDPVGFEIVDHFSPEAFGIACQDGATALANRMNEALDDLLGSDPYNPEFSTYYNETYETWMGSPPVVDLAQVKIALDDLIPAESDTDPVIHGYDLVTIFAVMGLVTVLLVRKNKYRK